MLVQIQKLPIATHFFAVSISWLQITQSSFASFGGKVLQRRAGSEATPAGPAVMIAGLSARRPRAKRTRTEARATPCFSRLSQRRSADWVSFGRLGPTSRFCSQNGRRTRRAFLMAHNSDDGCYSNPEICRMSDLQATHNNAQAPSRSSVVADWHALGHPAWLCQLARPMQTRSRPCQSWAGAKMPLEGHD